jgi:hypothetical protein
MLHWWILHWFYLLIPFDHLQSWVAYDTPNAYLLDISIIIYNFPSQQHILDFVINLYNYILVINNICD